MSNDKPARRKTSISTFSEAQKRALPHVRGPLSLEEALRLTFLVEHDQPLEIDAGMVADVLQDIADAADPTCSIPLQALARALRGEDRLFSIDVKYKGRGKPVTDYDHAQRWKHKRSLLRAVTEIEVRGLKTEAAVAEVAAKFGCSRASVFAALKDAEKWESLARKSAPGAAALLPPRPDKSRKS